MQQDDPNPTYTIYAGDGAFWASKVDKNTFNEMLAAGQIINIDRESAKCAKGYSLTQKGRKIWLVLYKRFDCQMVRQVVKGPIHSKWKGVRWPRYVSGGLAK